MEIESPIPFRPFSQYREVRVYQHGVLPHWRQHGCTYFVTFRLADSLPQSVASELREERNSWLLHHGIDPGGENWKDLYSELDHLEKKEFEEQVGQRLNEALDSGYGSCVLREAEVSKVVVESLKFFHGNRVWTGDYVVMPNHVHVLMTPVNKNQLEDILHSVKSYSAKQINKKTGQVGTLWQKESYDHIVRDSDGLAAVQLYIRNNPAKANLKEGQYKLSNKSIYAFFP